MKKKRKFIRKDLKLYEDAGFKIEVVKRCPNCGFESEVELSKEVPRLTRFSEHVYKSGEQKEKEVR